MVLGFPLFFIIGLIVQRKINRHYLSYLQATD